ncbi:cytochrome P450 [Hyphomicrobiales bacterium]|jgi:cytochrome P450|nr:cytochrome P450 [Hyphomicrobiales bacterium]
MKNKNTFIKNIDFMDPKTQSCPYESYKVLRKECPVYKLPDLGFYMITKYQDGRKILLDPKTFSNNPTQHESYEDEGAKAHAEIIESNGVGSFVETLQRTDPPVHTKYRKLLNKAFTAKRVKEMQPYISKIVNDLIDNFIDKGECEFVSDYAVPIPATIIADQLGVPRKMLKKLKLWSDAMIVSFGVASIDDMKSAAYLEAESQHYFDKVFNEKRNNPTNDIISELVNLKLDGGENLSNDELQGLVAQLLAGGNETTTSSIAHGLWLLLQHPDQMNILIKNPDLISNFVEEVIRFETPIQGLFRTVKEDTNINGEEIKKGSVILVRYASFNRDEEVFENPDQFDIERKDVGKHLAFGSGAHHCVGAMLARAEMKTAFKHLFERLKDIELSRPLPEIPHHSSLYIHQMKELPIKFSKR